MNLRGCSLCLCLLRWEWICCRIPVRSERARETCHLNSNWPSPLIHDVHVTLSCTSAYFVSSNHPYTVFLSFHPSVFQSFHFFLWSDYLSFYPSSIHLSIYFLSFPPSIDRSIIYPSIYCFSYCPYIHPFVFLSIIHPFIIFNNKILNIKTIFYYTVNCSFLFPFFSHCFFIFIHLMSIYQSIHHLFFSFPSIYLFLFFIFNSSELYWHVLHSIVKALTIAWTKNKLLFKKKN